MGSVGEMPIGCAVNQTVFKFLNNLDAAVYLLSKQQSALMRVPLNSDARLFRRVDATNEPKNDDAVTALKGLFMHTASLVMMNVITGE